MEGYLKSFPCFHFQNKRFTPKYRLKYNAEMHQPPRLHQPEKKLQHYSTNDYSDVYQENQCYHLRYQNPPKISVTSQIHLYKVFPHKRLVCVHGSVLKHKESLKVQNYRMEAVKLTKLGSAG